MRVVIACDEFLEALWLEVCEGCKEDGTKYVAIELSPAFTAIIRLQGKSSEFSDEKLTCLYDMERFSYAEALADARKRVTECWRDGQIDLQDLAIY